MVVLSIIVPVYNEKYNVALLAKSLLNVFKKTKFEIIFVDDSSPDGTADTIRSLKGFGNRIKLVERSGKLGLATAVVEGVKAAKGKLLLVMDGDLSHPPEIAYKLFLASKNYDLVIASRNVTGKRTHTSHRDFISMGAESLCRPLIGNKFTDPMSGFFLVKKNIISHTNIRVKGYKILLNLLHDNKDLKVKELPYIFGARYSGETKLDLNEGLAYLFDLFRLILR
ncbi:MAG: polyprenol monophosphomannose synthase [Candidatus Micrarchaeota archaeon]